MSSIYLFDLDGTLVDRLPSLKSFLPEQYSRYCTPDTTLADSFVERFLELEQSGHTSKYKVYETLVREFGLNASVSELVADFQLNAFKECEAQPGALALLEQLRLRGARLGVITNGSITAQQQKLKTSGIAARIEFSLIAEAAGMRKPDPAIFIAAARHLDAEPSSCMFIGDHPEKDIVGAQGVRMHTVWLRHGRTWPEHLCPPTFEISGLEEILALDPLSSHAGKGR